MTGAALERAVDHLAAVDLSAAVESSLGPDVLDIAGSSWNGSGSISFFHPPAGPLSLA